MGRGVSPAWMILEFRYALAGSDEVAGYHHNLMLRYRVRPPTQDGDQLMDPH